MFDPGSVSVYTAQFSHRSVLTLCVSGRNHSPRCLLLSNRIYDNVTHQLTLCYLVEIKLRCVFKYIKYILTQYNDRNCWDSFFLHGRTSHQLV